MIGRKLASRPAPAAPEEVERLRTVLTTAAHELRSPAATLAGLTHTLSTHRAQLAPATVDQLLDAISRQAQVIDRVTSDLLTVAQLGGAGISVTRLPVAVRGVLDTAALALPADGSDPVSCPADLVALADPVRVQQMVGNLVANAVRHGCAPVTLTAQRAGDEVVVRVCDSGPGVVPALRDRLFEPYARADPADSVGLGLGLHVVRTLAAVQGGTAWYDAAAGAGCCFAFSLPLAPSDDPEPAA